MYRIVFKECRPVRTELQRSAKRHRAIKKLMCSCHCRCDFERVEPAVVFVIVFEHGDIFILCKCNPHFNVFELNQSNRHGTVIHETTRVRRGVTAVLERQQISFLANMFMSFDNSDHENFLANACSAARRLHCAAALVYKLKKTKLQLRVSIRYPDCTVN